MANRDGPSHTLYVQNINDKIKPENLKKSLYLLFTPVGEVIDIHMHCKAKYRGQAWIVFKTARDADRAKSSLNGTPFYGKPLRIVESNNKSDIISKADGTYANRAQRKIDQLQSQLHSSIEGSDGVKRKLDPNALNDDEETADGLVKRVNLGHINKSNYSISTDPTCILFATNFPTSVNFDAIKLFFDTPTPLSVSLLDSNNSTPLLQSLSLPITQSVYKIEFSDDKDAITSFTKHNRFKFDADNRLRLAYLMDLTKTSNMTDDHSSIVSSTDPNANVSLATGGEVQE